MIPTLAFYLATLAPALVLGAGLYVLALAYQQLGSRWVPLAAYVAVMGVGTLLQLDYRFWAFLVPLAIITPLTARALRRAEAQGQPLTAATTSAGPMMLAAAQFAGLWAMSFEAAIGWIPALILASFSGAVIKNWWKQMLVFYPVFVLGAVLSQAWVSGLQNTLNPGL